MGISPLASFQLVRASCRVKTEDWGLLGRFACYGLFRIDLESGIVSWAIIKFIVNNSLSESAGTKP
jgi:hypothetical protein